MSKSNNQDNGISSSEMKYREGKKNDLLKKMQLQLGKTRDQVIELFRFYNKPGKKNKLITTPLLAQ